MKEKFAYGSISKINHANSRIDELDSRIQSHFAKNENKAILKATYDKDRNEHIVFIGEIPDLEEFVTELALLTGEIIHNTRSSLDLFVFELAKYNTKSDLKNHRNIYFPICDCEGDFQKKESNI